MQWTIETNDERGSERSVLPGRHDDDDSSKLLPCPYYFIFVILGLKTLKEKTRFRDDACCFKQILEIASNKTVAVRPFTSHLANHSIKTKKIWRALMETFFCKLLHMDTPIIADQQKKNIYQHFAMGK